MGCILRKFCIQRVLRPVRTLAQIFRKPKNWPMINWVQGIIYKVTRWAVMTANSPTLGNGALVGPHKQKGVSMLRLRITASTHETPRSSNLASKALLRLMELNFGQHHHQWGETTPLLLLAVYLKVNKMWGCSSSNNKLWYCIDELWWRQTEATENQLKATDWITKKTFSKCYKLRCSGYVKYANLALKYDVHREMLSTTKKSNGVFIPAFPENIIFPKH